MPITLAPLESSFAQQVADFLVAEDRRPLV